jgi:hypothetical protein
VCNGRINAKTKPLSSHFEDKRRQGNDKDKHNDIDNKDEAITTTCLSARPPDVAGGTCEYTKHVMGRVIVVAVPESVMGAAATTQVAQLIRCHRSSAVTKPCRRVVSSCFLRVRRPVQLLAEQQSS